MKEWNHLLNIVDAFTYDKELEKSVFDESEKSRSAKVVYDKIIEEFNLNEDENLKWAFDIALDCVRNMNDEDKDYLTESYDVDFFGYGMYIRNQYIHCATKHQRFLCADTQCSVVLSFIYTNVLVIMSNFADLSVNDKMICLYALKFPLVSRKVPSFLQKGKMWDDFHFLLM